MLPTDANNLRTSSSGGTAAPVLMLNSHNTGTAITMYNRSSSPTASNASNWGLTNESIAVGGVDSSSSGRSLVKNKTFHHPLGGGSSFGGGADDGGCSTDSPSAAADAEKSSTSRSSSSPLVADTLEARRKYKRSSARRSTSSHSSSSSSTGASSPDKSSAPAPDGGTATSENATAVGTSADSADDEDERSSLERQLIDLKLELAQSKADADGWNHAQSTVLAENAILRSQLGGLLDLEDEAHTRRIELENEVQKLQAREEARAEAEEEAARRLAEASQRQDQVSGDAGPDVPRSGSFSSIGDMIGALMGDSGHTRSSTDGDSDNDDDDSFDPYSDKKRDDMRRRSIGFMLGMSGLDEDDVRYAAAHERDCLLRENDRLRSDLDRGHAERDELTMRIDALEESAVRRERRVAALEEEEQDHQDDDDDNAGPALLPSHRRREFRASSATARMVSTTSSFDQHENNAPSSLRGYLSKVTSVRNNEKFNNKSSSWSMGTTQARPPSLQPPESLLWDTDDEQDTVKVQRPRAA